MLGFVLQVSLNAMELMNFWCRWCGSQTGHTIDWASSQQIETVTTRCSVCGATGSALVETKQNATVRDKVPDVQGNLKAIHQALRHAKKAED